MGNLPRDAAHRGGTEPLAFWAPAFSFHPRLFLRLAHQLTILQPHFKAEESGPLGKIIPIGPETRQTMGVVKVILTQIGVQKDKIFPLIPRLGVELRESSLVFLPFQQKGGDYIQPQMGFAAPKSAVQA